MTWMRNAAGLLAVGLMVAACGPSQQARIERGRYLVSVIGCGDCHTPGGLSPHPDAKRWLAGSDSEFQQPGLGVFVPPNLTPDKDSGIGAWSEDQIVTAFTKGVLPDGRILAPAMPWNDFANLTSEDAHDIAAYLKSLPPVSNKIPGPRAAQPAPAGTVEDIVLRK